MTAYIFPLPAWQDDPEPDDYDDTRVCETCGNDLDDFRLRLGLVECWDCEYDREWQDPTPVEAVPS